MQGFGTPKALPQNYEVNTKKKLNLPVKERKEKLGIEFECNKMKESRDIMTNVSIPWCEYYFLYSVFFKNKGCKRKKCIPTCSGVQTIVALLL